MSEDGQLRATPLILNYEPFFRTFVDTGQAIKVGSPRLARIDVFIPGFLAWRYLRSAQLPVQRVVQEVAILGEGVDSSHSSLEAEID